MKKVININFQGFVVPIEESAYDMLQKYTDSLRVYFATEEGKDEIINDIESRISELFQQRLKNGATCITEDDVNTILDNMGRPADFDEAQGATNTQSGPKATSSSSSSSSSQTNWQWHGKRLYRDENNKILGGVCSGIGTYLGVDPWIVRILFILTGIGFIAYIILWIFLPGSNSISTGLRKKLYRNPDDKIVAGVCGGIGSYFDVNPWLPRIIFLLPFITFIFRWHSFAWFTFPDLIRFTFSPGTLLIYIILWLVIPEAQTTSEKLEMKGEKVDLNSIKESVLREMKGVGERMEKMGKGAGDFIKEKGPEIGKDFGDAVYRSGNSLGNLIGTIIKIFLYIILACVAFSIIVAVFAVAIVAIGLFPLKSFFVADGWQTLLAWGTLIFFIFVPVIGIITYIIRKLARSKNKNNLLRYSFVGLWIFGWICLFALISFVGRDFKYLSTVNEQKIEITDPSSSILEIKPVRNNNYRWKGWLRIEPYSTYGFDADTALVGNVRIRIVKSDNDSFQVNYVKMSNGKTREIADKLAAKIIFKGYQQDSTLWINNAIAINKVDKFRNQFVEVTVAVPVNHRIKIDRDFGFRNRLKIEPFINTEIRYGRFEYDDYDYSYGEEYVMKDDGLHRVDEAVDASGDWSSGEGDGKYHYAPSGNTDSGKHDNNNEVRKLEKALDSLKNAQKKETERLQDSLKQQRDKIDQKLKSLENKTAFITPIPPVSFKVYYPFVSYI